MYLLNSLSLKKEIEDILRKHIDEKLAKEDDDFKNARWMQDDYTYSFKDGSPFIDVVIIIDDVQLRKPKK